MSISCVSCNYAITEPLCAHCIINEVKIWTYDKKINPKFVRVINKKLGNVLQRVDSLSYLVSPFDQEDSITNCIKCKDGMHLICLYCVINQAAQIVKSQVKNKLLIENFEESFNTNLYDYELKRELL